MDIRFTDEELAFQAEVQQFFANVMDDELKAKLHGVEASPDLKEGMIEYQRRLNARGWMAPGWPVEYGGQDWSVTQHFIFNAERGKAGAPAPIPFGVTMVAPVIYTYGTEEQKARFLPRILNSDDWWCQGYSEPGAGSDLASLQCKAERDGDEYVVNGSKIWTSFAQAADWIFCLVRTDNSGRKQEGISFLLIDMTTPGVTVSPIETIDGIYHLNEVHFDNARVPVDNRIGEEGKGWTYAKSLLVHERLSIAEVAADSIVKGVRIDASTEAMMTIGYGHHEVHAGSHYYYRDHYTLARAATKEFIIVTPDTTTWAHMVIGIEATTSTIDVALYEDAVTTDDGTAEPVINRNRNSAKVNGTLLFEDPTLTADGTEISSGIFGAGRNSNGGGGRDTEELVLKQNTKYLLRITEQNIQATSINIILDWYEHTDRN